MALLGEFNGSRQKISVLRELNMITGGTEANTTLEERAGKWQLRAHRQVHPKAGKSLLLVILASQRKSSQRLLQV